MRKNPDAQVKLKLMTGGAQERRAREKKFEKRKVYQKMDLNKLE